MKSYYLKVTICFKIYMKQEHLERKLFTLLLLAVTIMTRAVACTTF